MLLLRVFETMTLLQIHPLVKSYDSWWGKKETFNGDANQQT